MFRKCKNFHIRYRHFVSLYDSYKRKKSKVKRFWLLKTPSLPKNLSNSGDPKSNGRISTVGAAFFL